MKQEIIDFLIALRADNIDGYESRDVMSIIREIEELDEKYYSSFPGFQGAISKARFWALFDETLGERYEDTRIWNGIHLNAG